MKKLNAIAIAVMFLLSIFAGAFSAIALDPVHDVPVDVYDTNGAKLTADKIIVYDINEEQIGIARNVQTHTFLLSTGEYTIVAQKNGYDSADAWVPVTVNSSEVMQTIVLKLASTTGDTGGTDDGGTGDPTDPATTSDKVYVKDLNFDEDSKPAATVEFELEVETIDDYEAEDIEATLIVEGLDDGDDFEVDDIEVGDLEDDSTELKVELTIPVKAEEGEYTVKVQLKWEDDEGTYKNLDFVADDKLEVTRDEHDVQITKLKLSAETFLPGTEAEIGITLLNIGEEDEMVKVRVQSEELSVSETSAEFELEEGDEMTQYIPFTIPEDADGKYFVYVTAYFEGGETLQVITVNVNSGTTTTGAAVTVTPTVTVEDAEEAGWSTTSLLIAVLVMVGVIAVLAKEYAPKRPVVVASTRRRRR